MLTTNHAFIISGLLITEKLVKLAKWLRRMIYIGTQIWGGLIKTQGIIN